MNRTRQSQPFSPSERTILPVHGWRRIHFVTAIRQKRLERIFGPLFCTEQISEAGLVRTAEIGFPDCALPQEKPSPDDQ